MCARCVDFMILDGWMVTDSRLTVNDDDGLTRESDGQNVADSRRK